MIYGYYRLRWYRQSNSEAALEAAWQALNLAQPVLQNLTTQAKLDEIKLELFGAKQTTASPQRKTPR